MCFWRQNPCFLYFTRISQCDQTKLQRILTADTHRGLLCVKHCFSYFIMTDSLNPHKNLVNYYYILFIRLSNCNIGGLRNLPKITKILSVLCLIFGGFPCPQNKSLNSLARPSMIWTSGPAPLHQSLCFSHMHLLLNFWTHCSCCSPHLHALASCLALHS